MTETSTRAPGTGQVRTASQMTSVAFVGAGFGFASWAARIPQVRDHLDLSPSELGFVLLAVAAGSVLALPSSGPVVDRWGSHRTVRTMAVLFGVGLATVALGYRVGVAPVVVGLFLLGFGNGAWDVAMNVQGALVERHLRRSIMPRYHAGFSVGTVAGALLGAGAVALDVTVTVHLLVVAATVAVAVAWATRRFLPDDAPLDDGRASPDGYGAGGERPGALTAWREPRTVLVGVFVLAFAFAEGTGNDWMAVAMIDGHGAAASVGTLAFATFLAAMTAGRWFGPAILDRYGRVATVRALAVVGIGGTLVFVSAPTVPVAFVGALLWGAGVSLGFPVGMSAGADDPARAAGRVSVIASIGYVAFLGGPPLVGLLGDSLGVLRAVTAVAVLLGLAALIGFSVREPDRDG